VGGTSKGVIFKDLDASGNPTSIFINLPGVTIPNNRWKVSSGANAFLSPEIKYASQLKLICESIGDSALENCWTPKYESKFKVDCTSIGSRAFYGGGGESRKIWLSKKVQSCGDLAFHTSRMYLYTTQMDLKMYCESPSKPTGYADGWNQYSYVDASHTASYPERATYWGVSEASFDAL